MSFGYRVLWMKIKRLWKYKDDFLVFCKIFVTRSEGPPLKDFDPNDLIGENNTFVSTYTLYMHLQQYCSHPWITDHMHLQFSFFWNSWVQGLRDAIMLVGGEGANKYPGNVHNVQQQAMTILLQNDLMLLLWFKLSSGNMEKWRRFDTNQDVIFH